MLSTAAAADTAGRAVPRIGVLLAVLGVVYGDIGTSPLYAFKASLQLFDGHADQPASRSWASCR